MYHTDILCHLSWLTNSALVYEHEMRGGEGGGWVVTCGVLSQWVQLCTWSPNKLWRSNSILNLCCRLIYGLLRTQRKPAPLSHIRVLSKPANLTPLVKRWSAEKNTKNRIMIYNLGFLNYTLFCLEKIYWCEPTHKSLNILWKIFYLNFFPVCHHFRLHWWCTWCEYLHEFCWEKN